MCAQNVVHIGTGIFQGRTIPYEVVDGRAMFESDIDLGPADDLHPASVELTSAQSRWPNGYIPYIIDSNIPNPQRILDAINAWNTSTVIKLSPRASELNYVHFIQVNSGGRCSSSSGMLGGEQFLRVDDTCSVNTLVHEIGHTVGLGHEQARADRDYYVTVDYSHADKRYFGDHNMQPATTTDIGGYDYGSIMQYFRYEGARKVQLPVYETIPPGMALDGSAAHGLSPGDIDTVTWLYGAPPSATTISTNPSGLQVIVDGVTISAPQSFNWEAGSQHTVDVPDKQGDATPVRYLFGRWNDNGPQAHTITASADLTVFQASFIRQYKVTAGASPANAGSVTLTPVSSDGYFNDGSLLTITETPAAGFTFGGWNGTGSTFYVNVTGWSAPTSTIRVTIPNLSYIAHYTQSPLVVVTTDPPGLPITVNGLRGAGPRNIVANGSPVTVAADATLTQGLGSEVYVFDSWSDGGSGSHTIAAPGPGTTVTAIYKLRHLVTTAIAGLGTVAVTPASPDGYYDDGAIIQITATPATGWKFTGWGRDLSGAGVTQNVTITDQFYAVANFQRPFALTPPGIVNAASFLGGPVSPGEIVTIFADQIGPPGLTTAQLDSSGRVATTLAGSRVFFDGVAAPLIYVSPNQIAAIVPYEVAGKLITAVQVSLNGQVSTPALVPVTSAAPAMFTSDSSGRGLGAILNQDTTINSPANPALRGSTVVLFVTGEGQTTPGGVDGAIASSVFPRPAAQPVSVLFGGPKGVGKSAQILYAGAAPGEVAGVMQINAVIPVDAPSGNVPVSFSVGGMSSIEMTTVAIQ